MEIFGNLNTTKMKDENLNKINWIFEQHKKINHMYDDLPYIFHLKMVNKVAQEFQYLIPNSNDGTESLYDAIMLASFGHDLIEDTHVTYNDVKEVLGYTAAEIIYALTNEKGKNRKERANDKYYLGICDTEGAVFVKLCDRIANIRYGKITDSRMVDMYKKENSNFVKKLGYKKGHIYEKMFDYLDKILND